MTDRDQLLPEVEGMIEEAAESMTVAWDRGADGVYVSKRLSKPILRYLVRQALATSCNYLVDCGAEDGPCRHHPDTSPCISCLTDEIATVRAALATVTGERDAAKASERHKSEGLRLFMNRADVAEERVRALEEALRPLLERYDHLCSVLAIRDSTWEIRERAMKALSSASPASSEGAAAEPMGLCCGKSFWLDGVFGVCMLPHMHEGRHEAGAAAGKEK